MKSSSVRSSGQGSFDTRIEKCVPLIRNARRITAFTGAGISTESGLSDFRSPGGVWDRYRVVTFQEFVRSHEARVEFWTMKRDFYHELERARPNKAHQALAELERRGRLECVITQNIDGLHQESGNSPDRVIELHGTNRKAVCLSCRRTWPIGEIQTRLESGDLDPRCEKCQGLIKPATISFGQAMPEEEMRRAFECAETTDLMLMIGSSLQVAPAASIPPHAHTHGANLIFINRTQTPWDHLSTVLFRESASEVMGGLINGIYSRAC
ncbi:MAG: NAD-dependent deacylase [Acidobacteriia bacterium]|nr:NAD-dependent deacylase [Terriglobia bacterium]